MGQDTLDIVALLDAMAESPRRDNSAYHAAMAEARRAFEDAEAALGYAREGQDQGQDQAKRQLCREVHLQAPPIKGAGNRSFRLFFSLQASCPRKTQSLTILSL